MPPHSLSTDLAQLTTRLEQLQRVHSLDDYESLLRFQVKVLPRILEAERCSIFLPDLKTGQAWLQYGTGVGDKQIAAPLHGSIVGEVITTGQGVVENHLDQRPGFHATMASRTGFVTRNMVCVPIRSPLGGQVIGAVQVLNRLGGLSFGDEERGLLEETAQHLAVAMENLFLRNELARLSSQLRSELERQEEPILAGGRVVAVSQAMRQVLALARMVSTTPVNVFIHGENGTGKEVVAHLIHNSGNRRGKPFVAVNCAAIPETLIESEFFGYEKGAFTGAEGSRKGRFEEAEDGTLFLDEVGEMPLAIQPKFLRAIQEREGTRLGSNRLSSYQFRLVSATNRDLKALVGQGRFREDLFYRLFSVEIRIPPLRERREDIVPLAMTFLEETRQRFGKWIDGLAPEVVEAFEAHPWPGNVRQLRQEVERLVALTPEGKQATLAAGSEGLQQVSREELVQRHAGRSLPYQVQALEIQLIRNALQESGGNKVQAARLLGITRQGLHKKMQRYGLE